MATRGTESDSVREERRLGYYTGQYEMRLEQLDRAPRMKEERVLDDFVSSEVEQVHLEDF